MHSSRLLKATPVLLVSFLLGACGGDDDDSSDKAGNTTPTEITERQANALKLDTPRAEVFRQLGAKPRSSRKLIGPVNRKNPELSRKRFTCYRFGVKGEVPSKKDFADLCFDKTDTLQSVLTNVAIPAEDAAEGAQGGETP